MNNKKYRKPKESMYETYSCPLTKIIKMGCSYYVNIPIGVIRKHRLKEGDDVIPAIHKRVSAFSDEITKDEIRELALAKEKVDRQESELQKSADVAAKELVDKLWKKPKNNR